MANLINGKEVSQKVKKRGKRAGWKTQQKRYQGRTGCCNRRR